MDRKDKARKNSSSSSSSSSAASMAALAAAAAAGDSGVALPSPMEEDKKPRLVASLVPVAGGFSSASAAGGSGACAAGASSSSSSFVAAAARRGAGRAGGVAAGGGGGGGGPRCQVERCGVDLSEAGRYNRRHKVCQTHSKEPVVLVAGLRQRFCQQCSRFHELTEFDDAKRSCRRRLAGHNERRRKSAADTQGENCRHADQDGRSHPGPGNPPFQIR